MTHLDVETLWANAASGGHVGKVASEQFTGMVTDALAAHHGQLAANIGVGEMLAVTGRTR